MHDSISSRPVDSGPYAHCHRCDAYVATATTTVDRFGTRLCAACGDLRSDAGEALAAEPEPEAPRQVTTIAVAPRVQIVVTAGHAGSDQVGLTLRGPHTSITAALPTPVVDALTEALAAAAPPYVLPYHEVWSNEVAPGGLVCGLCGVPVESEPCSAHAPMGGVR